MSDESDLTPPDLDSTESATEIYERLEAYQSSGGDVEALLDSDSPEKVSEPERPASADEEPTEPDSEDTGGEEASADEEVGQDQPTREPPPEASSSAPPPPSPVPSDEEGDDERAPKPDFDPAKLEGDARKVRDYYEQVRRYQQSRGAKKIHSIIGDRRPEHVREVLNHYDMIESAPEFESVRTLIRGTSEFGPLVDAALNPNHPAHENAVARLRRAMSDVPVNPQTSSNGNGHDRDEQLVRAVMDPETGDIDPRRIEALVRNAAQRAYEQQPATSFEGWANANGIPHQDRLEMQTLWEQDNRPAFPDSTRVRYFESLKKRIEDDRKQEWEKARVEELRTHVAEATPKRKSAGPGTKSQKIDWDKYDDPVDFAAAITNGDIDLDDPEVRRRANLD